MTIRNDADIRTLTDAEITAVAGGCDHGSGNRGHEGRGDGLGVLLQTEGAILNGLGAAASGASKVVNTIINMF
jgi:hypothetical protein